MLTLITGFPGNGKTLYLLNLVQAERGERPVYYFGINELTLDWNLIADPLTWFDVPAGSIVVIDECQKHGIFPTRGTGSVAPRHVKELETHRHSGLDVYLATQHPMLVDPEVRRLSERHMHSVRSFGMERSSVHEWQGVRTDCEKSRKDSIVHKFAFPRASYSWYKSAEVHTVKRRIPMRVFFLFALPLILGGLIWAFVKFWHTPGTTKPVSSPGVVSGVPGVPGTKIKTVSQFVDERHPRIVGLAYTAPIYDEVTKPTDAPFPAACIVSAKSCNCYSQQGTALDVPADLCASIVKRGFFQDWEPKQARREQNYQNQQRVASSNPLPVAADIDRTKKYLTIEAPPVLRASPGFGPSDPFEDKQQGRVQPKKAPSAPPAPS